MNNYELDWVLGVGQWLEESLPRPRAWRSRDRDDNPGWEALGAMHWFPAGSGTRSHP